MGDRAAQRGQGHPLVGFSRVEFDLLPDEGGKQDSGSFRDGADSLVEADERTPRITIDSASGRGDAWTCAAPV